MCRLLEARGIVIGKEKTTMGALVYKIDVEGGKVAVTYSTDGCVPSRYPKYRKIRSAPHCCPIIYSPLTNLECNLRQDFGKRKNVEHPTFGGQSTTDLPSQWIVYPSYGIGDKGKGYIPGQLMH